MPLLHRLASALRWLVHRKRVEQDLNDELETFVEFAAADRMQTGVPPAEARRQAVLYLGGVEQAKERVRSGRHGAWLDVIGRDVQKDCGKSGAIPRSRLSRSRRWRSASAGSRRSSAFSTPY